MQVAGRWTRLATYPVGALPDSSRKQLWDQISRMIPPEAAVFQETPWASYNMMMIFSILRTPVPVRWSITAPRRDLQPRHHRQPDPGLDHRPRDLSRVEREAAPAGRMWPYRYDQPQPTTLALGQRGDYRLLRRPGAGAWGRRGLAQFMTLTAGKIETVGEAPPTRSGRRIALHLGPSDRRHGVPLLSQGVAGRPHARHPHPRRQRQRPSLDDVLRQLYQRRIKREGGSLEPTGGRQ